MDKAQKER